MKKIVLLIVILLSMAGCTTSSDGPSITGYKSVAIYDISASYVLNGKEALCTAVDQWPQNCRDIQEVEPLFVFESEEELQDMKAYLEGLSSESVEEDSDLPGTPCYEFVFDNQEADVRYKLCETYDFVVAKVNESNEIISQKSYYGSEDDLSLSSRVSH
ncbi:MAG: hypothetical protein GX775_00345 [Erysipelothrix sp.]|nr:hypothetical protein [Erysipelothrix sp.]